jgi:hypothetical protein
LNAPILVVVGSNNGLRVLGYIDIEEAVVRFDDFFAKPPLAIAVRLNGCCWWAFPVHLYN